MGRKGASKSIHVGTDVPHVFATLTLSEIYSTHPFTPGYRPTRPRARKLQDSGTCGKLWREKTGLSQVISQTLGITNSHSTIYPSTRVRVHWQTTTLALPLLSGYRVLSSHLQPCPCDSATTIPAQHPRGQQRKKEWKRKKEKKKRATTAATLT